MLCKFKMMIYGMNWMHLENKTTAKKLRNRQHIEKGCRTVISETISIDR